MGTREVRRAQTRARISRESKAPKEEVTKEELIAAESELEGADPEHGEDYHDTFAARMMMWHEQDGRRVAAKEGYLLQRDLKGEKESFVKAYALTVKALAAIEDRLVEVLVEAFGDDESKMRDFLGKRHQLGTMGSSMVPEELANELATRALEDSKSPDGKVAIGHEAVIGSKD